MIKFKTTLLNWLAVYLFVTLLFIVFGNLLSVLPLFFRTLLLTCLLVFSMTYLIAPAIKKIFNKWLSPKNMKKAKQVVTDYMTEVWINKNVEALPKYISLEKFIQHSPNLDNGIKALQDFLPYLFNTLVPRSSWQVNRIIAENDLVVVHSLMQTEHGKGTAVVDIFRLEDDKIVEHWDMIHDVPETTKNGNPIV
jgi:predicted SnoaL-like aldol condensation-catalyzing enzyme